MAFVLSGKSLEKLNSVHPDLQKVIKQAIQETPVDFGVTCGLRTLEEQKKLFASGASRTMRSRHLTGHAVDLAAYVSGKLTWEWSYYEQIAQAVKDTAKELGIPLDWGGECFGPGFKDGPHFQLPWKKYP